MKLPPLLQKVLHWIRELLESICLLFICSLIAYIPILIFIAFASYSRNDITFIILLGLISFLWGWQTHQRNIIFIIIPIFLFSTPSFFFCQSSATFISTIIFFLCVLITRKVVSHHNGLGAEQCGTYLVKAFFVAIALLIFLTWFIPRYPHGDGMSQNTAIAKEAASMVSGSFSAHQVTKKVTPSTTAQDLIHYMNYVAMDTSKQYKANYKNEKSLTKCSERFPCLKLHNGGILQYDRAQSFGTNQSDSVLIFNLDPDGDGQRGYVTLVQFYSGRLTTGQNYHSSGLNIQTTDPEYLQNWN